MKRQILLSLLLFASLSLSAQVSEVEMNCRVLTPEEYGGNGYIISHKHLIDGAFVEVTNIQNRKKSTAVVRYHGGAEPQGVISSTLAVNLGIPFNGTAAVSVRYISFLNNREDVFAPFFTAEETDSAQLEAQIAEKQQQQEKEIEKQAEKELEEAKSTVAAIPEERLPEVTAEAVAPKTQTAAANEALPIPEWKAPAEERLVLNERKGNPVESEEKQRQAALPDPSLFEMNYIEERLLRDGTDTEHEARLPEVDIECPGYIDDKTAIAGARDEYTREVDEIPAWQREWKAESSLPRPKNVTVSVNGNEIALSHYPEIESDCYHVIDDKMQVKKINSFFRLESLRLPQTVIGVGVEDPVSGDSDYFPTEIAEPQPVEIQIKKPEPEPIIEVEETEPEATQPEEVIFIELEIEESQPEESIIKEIETAIEEVEPEESSIEIEEPQPVEPAPIIISEPERPESPLISGALYLQTGAFESEAAAEKQAAQLRSWFPTVVFRVESNGNAVYKTAVGPLSQDELGVVRLYLKSLKITDAFPIIGR